MGGFHIAADCMVPADQGAPTGQRQRYVAAVRERCGRGRDRAFVVVVKELERQADAGELGTTAALLDFVEELKQDVPDTSDARARLSEVLVTDDRLGYRQPTCSRSSCTRPRTPSPPGSNRIRVVNARRPRIVAPDMTALQLAVKHVIAAGTRLAGGSIEPPAERRIR
jgi:hypothetical protein